MADLLVPLDDDDEEATYAPGGCAPEGCASVPGPALAAAKGPVRPPHDSRDHCLSVLALGRVRPVVLGQVVHEIPGVEVAGPQVAARPPLTPARPLQPGPGADVHIARSVLPCG